MAFPAGWTNKIKISINPDYIDSALTNWTMVFDQSFSPKFTQENGPLDADGGFSMLNGGGDLRASSDAEGLTRLPIDVRSAVIDNDPANGKLEIAVKIPSVSNTVATDIYIWWGKSGETQPSASDTYGQYNAYDSNYLGVWADGGGSDRTSNQNNGTADGVSVGDTEGQVGVATDASSGNFENKASNSWGFNSSSNITLCRMGKTDRNYRDVWFHNNATYTAFSSGFESDSYTFYYRDSSGTFIKLSGTQNVVGDDSYHYFVTVTNGTSVNNYVDNLPDSNANNLAQNGTFGDMGTRNVLFASTDMIADEVRLSNTTRSSAWLKADYNNLFNTSGFLTVSNVDQAFIPEEYTSRMKVTLSHAFVDTTLTDWTLVFDQNFDSRMTAENGPLDADGANPILNGGADIRVTSDSQGLNRLPIDVRSAVIDNDPANGKLEIAVKIPSLSGLVDTDIYIWWGNPDAVKSAADGVYGQYNAYDGNSKIRLPDAGGNDRTSNGNNMTASGGVSVGGATGKVGKATYFDGSNDYVYNSSISPSFSGNFTFSFMLKYTYSPPSSDPRLSDFAQASDRGLNIKEGRGPHVIGFDDSGGPSDEVYSPSGQNDGKWHLVIVRRSGTNYNMYYDGSNRGSNGGTAPTYTRLFLGARNEPSLYFRGYLDEVRIDNTYRSNAWIKADYHNLFNTSGFITFSDIKHRDADERYFVGEHSWIWNDDRNWSLFSGEPGGHSVPGVLEEAVFDSNSPSCSSAIDINVKSFDVRDDFAYAIHLNGNDLNQADTDGVFNVKGGSLNIGAGSVTIESTSVDISVDIPSYTGSMIFNVDVGDNQEIYGGATFNGNVEMRVSQSAGAGRTRTIDEPITITGDIYLQECELPKEYTQDGWIYKDGTGTVSGDGDRDFVIMNLKLKFIGDGDVTFYGMEAYHAEVTYDKTSGTVIMEDRHAFVGRSIITYNSATDYLTNAVNAQFRADGYGDVQFYPNVEPTYSMLILSYFDTGGLPSTYDFNGGVINVADLFFHITYPASSIGKLNNGTIKIGASFSYVNQIGSIGDVAGTAVMKFVGGDLQTYRDPSSIKASTNDIIIEKDSGTRMFITDSMKVGPSKDITVASGILVASGDDYIHADNLVVNNPNGELLILSGDVDIDVTLLTNNNYVRTDYPASLPSGLVNNKFITPSVYFGYKTAPFWDDASKIHDKLTPNAMYRKAFN